MKDLLLYIRVSQRGVGGVQLAASFSLSGGPKLRNLQHKEVEKTVAMESGPNRIRFRLKLFHNFSFHFKWSGTSVNKRKFVNFI